MVVLDLAAEGVRVNYTKWSPLLARIVACAIPALLSCLAMIFVGRLWPIMVLLFLAFFWLSWQVTEPRPERGESMRPDDPRFNITGDTK